MYLPRIRVLIPSDLLSDLPSSPAAHGMALKGEARIVWSHVHVPQSQLQPPWPSSLLVSKVTRGR